MVTIRETFSVIKELVGGLLVEFGSLIFSQTMVSHVEGGIFSLLDPVSPLGPLEAMSWPIPCVLRLNNVKFTIKAESHSVMTYF